MGVHRILLDVTQVEDDLAAFRHTLNKSIDTYLHRVRGQLVIITTRDKYTEVKWEAWC